MASSGIDSPGLIIPRRLHEGDRIAIVAPAGPVESALVEEAARVLERHDYRPEIFPTIYSDCGQTSAPARQRFEEMKEAFLNPEFRAVLCARGGYGSVHLLENLSRLPLKKDPKWLIGFSDITALHALMTSRGIASLHASMARYISRDEEIAENRLLFDCLKGSFPSFQFASDPKNICGKAEAPLVGGNLSVMMSLTGTPFNIVRKDTILFIEDISEPAYKIERMLYQLLLSGALENLKGIIVGAFTNIGKGRGSRDVVDVISEVLQKVPGIPVAYNLPIGHIPNNIPLVESAVYSLDITPERVTLSPKIPQI